MYSNSNSTSNGGVAGLNVAMICGTNTDPTYGEMTLDVDVYTTSMTSTYGCPLYTYNALVQFVLNNKWLFGSIFVVIGLFLAFAGRKLFNVAVFIIGAVIAIGVILVIFYSTFM